MQVMEIRSFWMFAVTESRRFVVDSRKKSACSLNRGYVTQRWQVKALNLKTKASCTRGTRRNDLQGFLAECNKQNKRHTWERDFGTRILVGCMVPTPANSAYSKLIISQLAACKRNLVYQKFPRKHRAGAFVEVEQIYSAGRYNRRAEDDHEIHNQPASTSTNKHRTSSIHAR